MRALLVGWLIVATVIAVGCSAGKGPTGPTSTVIATDMSYDINIPLVATAHMLQGQYPNGIRMAPLEAQRTWDFTAAYGGSPNVYYGEVSPCHEYIGAGIVVAPHSAAGLAAFTAPNDWPGIAPGRYEWVGRFVYTRAATPGEYQHDSTCVVR